MGKPLQEMTATFLKIRQLFFSVFWFAKGLQPENPQRVLITT
jgi:hypothetical protein